MEIKLKDNFMEVEKSNTTPSSDGCKSTIGSVQLPRSPIQSVSPFINEVKGRSKPKHVSIVGACVKEGQNYYTGVENAPEAFRKAGLLQVMEGSGCIVNDAGDIKVNKFVEFTNRAEGEYYTKEEVKNAPILGDSIGRLYDIVKRESDKGHFVLTLGGDHSIAAGTISAIKKSKNDICVVWVDAHADCNTPETSPSGNFHGMPVGLLLNWFKKRVEGFEWIEDYLKNPLTENRIAYIGLRDIDEREKTLLRESNMLVYSMIDVDRLGIAGLMEEIIGRLSPDTNPRPIHLSFDIDAVDPQFAPGTGTRARGGLNYREARYICTRLADTKRLESMDLVEINPDIDTRESHDCHEHGDNPSVNSNASLTLKLGIDLIEFALGKTLV